MPAGATVLIVSLRLLRTLTQMVTIAAGVVLFTGVGWLADRASDVPVPVWGDPG
jgi:hypothetical protein